MGRFRFTFAAVLFAGSMGVTSLPVDAAGPGSIIGAVTNAGGQPLAGVEYSTGFSFGPKPTTDGTGAYSLDGLYPGGVYQVVFHDTSGLYADVVSAPVTVLEDGPAVQDVVLPDAVLSVRGRVTDGDGNPVAGVVVRDQNNYWVAATTNSDGFYGLSGLADGSHDLSFDTWPNAQTFRPTTLTGVVVQAGAVADGDVVLQRYARIDIDVTAAGLPANASATLWLDLEFDNPVGYGHTDENGLLSFTVGADGDYFVQIFAEQQGYADEFFPDTIDRELAQRIHVAGDEVVQLTASLEEQAIISGTVLLPDGSPGSPYDVTARPAGLSDNAPMEVRTCNLPADTDPPGTFRIGCLHPSGDWVLKAYGLGIANNEYYQDSQSPTHATVIAVNAGQVVTGIVIQLDPKSPEPTLTGLSQQYFLAGTTTPEVRVYGTNFPSDPDAMSLTSGFWFSGVNATLKVTSVVSSNEAIATVTVSPGTIGATPEQRSLNLQSALGGGAECACQLYLGDATTQAATAAGRVTDSRGRPVRFATVELRTPNPNSSTGFDSRNVITGTDGRWSAGGLTPATYQVVFHGTTQLAGQWWSRKTSSAAAGAITPASGQTTTGIDARLGRRDQIEVDRAKQKYQTAQLNFDLLGQGLSPINGDFRVSIDYGWGMVPLEAVSTSDEMLHVTGYAYGTGPFDIVTEWTRADGTVASTRCVACIAVYEPLQLYAYNNTVVRGETTTLTLAGSGLTDLKSAKLSGRNVTIKSWSVDEFGQLNVVVTAKPNAAVGVRTLTVTRVDGATATVDVVVV